MTKQSAGLLLYKIVQANVRLFLVHPGGPFWKNKDDNAWSIPKGEIDETEEPLQTAIRECKEETGITVTGRFIELQAIVQKGGKKVFAWAVEKDADADNIISNTFEIEWPPKSGIYKSFPEVDRAAWFTVEEAKKKINASQAAFINELLQKLLL